MKMLQTRRFNESFNNLHVNTHSLTKGMHDSRKATPISGPRKNRARCRRSRRIPYRNKPAPGERSVGGSRAGRRRRGLATGRGAMTAGPSAPPPTGRFGRRRARPRASHRAPPLAGGRIDGPAPSPHGPTSRWPSGRGRQAPTDGQALLWSATASGGRAESRAASSLAQQSPPGPGAGQAGPGIGCGARRPPGAPTTAARRHPETSRAGCAPPRTRTRRWRCSC